MKTKLGFLSLVSIFLSAVISAFPNASAENIKDYDCVVTSREWVPIFYELEGKNQVKANSITVLSPKYYDSSFLDNIKNNVCPTSLFCTSIGTKEVSYTIYSKEFVKTYPFKISQKSFLEGDFMTIPMKSDDNGGSMHLEVGTGRSKVDSNFQRLSLTLYKVAWAEKLPKAEYNGYVDVRAVSEAEYPINSERIFASVQAYPPLDQLRISVAFYVECKR